MTALLRRGRRRPSAAHTEILARYFAGLDSGLVEAFYANFGYAAPLSLIVHLQELCAALQPQLVVEIGSGLTTHALATGLEPHALLVSIDESPEWLARSASGLPGRAHTAFVAAPGDGGFDYDGLGTLLEGRRPGLVVVDGPSRSPRFSRQAQSFFAGLVSPECAVAVDDTDRAENDEGAARLAAAYSLRKLDYGDPIYTGHQYSLLLPQGALAPAAVVEAPGR